MKRRMFFLRKRTLNYITQQLSCAATWISLNIDAHNTHVGNKITKNFFDLSLFILVVLIIKMKNKRNNRERNGKHKLHLHIVDVVIGRWWEFPTLNVYFHSNTGTKSRIRYSGLNDRKRERERERERENIKPNQICWFIE